MAYDPDLGPIFDGINAQIASIIARLDRLDGAIASVPRPAVPRPMPSRKSSALEFVDRREEVDRDAVAVPLSVATERVHLSRRIDDARDTGVVL